MLRIDKQMDDTNKQAAHMSKETHLHEKRPTKETYERDLQKKHDRD